MRAEKQNLTINQGATFRFNIAWKQSDLITPVDLTGYTARMHIRLSVDAVDPPLVSLTDVNGGIILGATAGTIQLYINDTDTAALGFTSGVYDLELVDTGDTGDVTRLMEGGVEVSPEVTR